MSRFRRGVWLFPLFQIPLFFLVTCLLLTTLFWLLGLGRPKVAVAFVLDLSSSTYTAQSFNAPGSILSKEFAAVNSYLDQNAQLKNPNQVQIFGFRSDQVLPMTDSFETSSQAIRALLAQKLNSNLPNSLPTEPKIDNLNQSIQKGMDALVTLQGYCRELLTVSDPAVELSPVALIPEALKGQVRINSIVFNGDVPDLRAVTTATKGIYQSGKDDNIEAFFTQQFFPRFNSNLRWIVLWLGGAWIALMWLLTLPLDQWIFQGLMKLPMSPAGQLSLGNALFWSVATPIVVWGLWKVVGSPLFVSGC